MRVLAVLLCLLLVAAPVLSSQSKAVVNEASLQWGPAPAVFPRGARMAVVDGDPAKAAQFTVILTFPDGYKIPPHFHPTDETVTVKRGMLLVGMGDTLNAAKTSPMTGGETSTIPAQAHHFAVTSGATVITITAMGPFAMTYVNPADDPQTHTGRP
jgi:quercetin dioxygenase-like cupin family protein